MKIDLGFGVCGMEIEKEVECLVMEMRVQLVSELND